MKTLTAVSLLLVIVCLQVACSDDSLKKASKSMLVLATTVGEIQKNTQLAEDQKLIDKLTADKIFSVCVRINVAGKQVDSILRTVEKLTPENRKNVIELITPIAASLDPQQIEFVANIKDPAVRQQIEGGLILARSVLSSIQLVIASGS